MKFLIYRNIHPDEEVYEDGKLYVDGEIVDDANMVFALMGSKGFLKILYAVFCMLVLLVTFCVCVLTKIGYKKFEGYFVVLGLFWGLIFMIMFQ